MPLSHPTTWSHLVAFYDDRTTAATRGAWSAALATVAAWPPGELVSPVLERRFVRLDDDGPLVECFVVTLDDRLGVLSAREADAELHALAHPVRARIEGILLTPDDARDVMSAGLGYIAELRVAHAVVPEGTVALSPLLGALLAGLAAIPGNVSLSIAVAPAPYDATDALDPEAPYIGDHASDELRRVRFRIRLAADHPIPTALHARAEALCIARRPQPGTWFHTRGPAEAARVARSVAAGLMHGWDGEDPHTSALAASVTLDLPAGDDGAEIAGLVVDDAEAYDLLVRELIVALRAVLARRGPGDPAEDSP